MAEAHYEYAKSGGVESSFSSNLLVSTAFTLLDGTVYLISGLCWVQSLYPIELLSCLVAVGWVTGSTSDPGPTIASSLLVGNRPNLAVRPQLHAK